MNFIVCFFFCQCIIICNYYEFVYANPVIGNVRRLRDTEYPFVTAIARIDTNNPELGKVICIGTLITTSDILTAEHCMEDEIIAQIAILAGSFNLTCATRYYVYWWITFEQWSQNVNIPIEFPTNDIAIIRLLPSARITIEPVQVLYLKNCYYYGLQVTVATWTSLNGNQISDGMDVAGLTLISNDECQNYCMQFGQQNIEIPERLMCSIANPYVILTSGDSGGPLLYDNCLIAINCGIYPAFATPGSTNERRLNYHLGLNNYRTFITSVTDIS